MLHFAKVLPIVQFEGEALMRTKFWLLTIIAFVLCTVGAEQALTAQGDYDRQAKQILDATAFRGGIIVHLGCGDGKLTAALRLPRATTQGCPYNAARTQHVIIACRVREVNKYLSLRVRQSEPEMKNSTLPIRVTNESCH